MNDVQRDEKLGGELAMGLFLLGAPAASRSEQCADRYPRKLLLVLILLVGGAASLGTALARSYSDLFWMRLSPASRWARLCRSRSHSWATCSAPSQRTAASGRVGVAMSAGVGFGQAMSGVPALRLDSWRAPFVVVGVLFVALAAVVWIAFVSRGAAHSMTRARMRTSLVPKRHDAISPRCSARRRRCLSFCKGYQGCVPWGVIIVYLQDYLQADLGLSLERSAMVLTCFAIGGFGGQFIGGELGQRLYTWRKPAAAWHMSIAEFYRSRPRCSCSQQVKADASFANWHPSPWCSDYWPRKPGP